MSDGMNSRLTSIINGDNCMEINVISTIQSDMFHKLNEYRLQNDLCDVTIVVDGQNLYGHRNILAAASPYFETMFKSGLLESTLGVVNIKEISYETMDQIVSFFYTGMLTLTTIENAQSVIAAAHYFLMTDLVEECAKYVFAQLTIDNCLSIWKFLKSFDAALSHINNYVASYFPKLAMSETYLELEIDDFIEFLSIDQPFYGADIDACGARWLDYHENRNVHGERIQQCTKSFEKNQTSGGWMLVFPEIREEECDVKDCAKLYNPINKKWVENGNIGALKNYGEHIVVDTSNMYIVKRRLKKLNMKKYNFDAKVWTEMPSLNGTFMHSAITIHKTKIYLCGGFNALDHSVQAMCYSFELQTNEWSQSPPMLQGKFGHCVAVIGKYIYACGGRIKLEIQKSSSVERFDIDAQRWESVQPMLTPKFGFTLAVYKNHLYALDGKPNESDFEMYDPATDNWTKLAAPSLTNFHDCRLVATHEGIYLLQKTCENSTGMHFYNVEQNKWSRKSGDNVPFAVVNAVTVPIFPYDI